MINRIHPDQRLPVFGVRDVDQMVEFAFADSIRDVINISQGISDASFLRTEDHSTEVGVDDVRSESFEFSNQLKQGKKLTSITVI